MKRRRGESSLLILWKTGCGSRNLDYYCTAEAGWSVDCLHWFDRRLTWSQATGVYAGILLDT